MPDKKRFCFASLTWLALRLAKTKAQREYPQLWWYNATLRKRHKTLAMLWQSVCGKLTGHELSKTEHGYSGGRYIDRWCRWCNTRIQIPIEQSIFAREYPDLIDEIAGSNNEG